MALPKYEGAITFATAQTFTVAFSTAGGSDVAACSVDAGTYYLTSSTSLLTTVAASIVTGLAGGAGVVSPTSTATLSDADASATGKVSITVGGTLAGDALIAVTEITWDTTALRDALGFQGTETSGTGNYHAGSGSLWLPGNTRGPGLVPDGHAGLYESDGTITVSPSGYTKALSYTTTRQRDVVTHSLELARRVWSTYVTYTNEAWETFWRNTVALGKPFRYHPDRTDDATYVTYVADAEGMRSFGAAPAIDGWTTSANSLWNISLPVRKKL
jgi:hypothetical protein